MVVQTINAEYKPKQPILIGLMGVTGSGKSNFIRTLSGDKRIVTSSGLTSCTKEVMSATIEIHGQKVELVDTPGFSDTKMSDAEVLAKVATWMKDSYDDGRKLHGIVYLQRITDARMDSGAVRSLIVFRKICGEGFYKNTAMVTTRWDEANNSGLFEQREEELKKEHWGSILKKGAKYHRSDNSRGTFIKIISGIVGVEGGNMPELQKQVGEEKKNLNETAAGGELGQELAKQQKLHEQNLKEAKELYEELLREGERKMAEEIAKHSAQVEEQLKKSKRDQEIMGFWRAIGRAFDNL